MNEQTELLPCPFCGCEDIRLIQETFPNGEWVYGYWGACCRETCCGCSMEHCFISREAAASFWNRRSNCWSAFTPQELSVLAANLSGLPHGSLGDDLFCEIVAPKRRAALEKTKP